MGGDGKPKTAAAAKVTRERLLDTAEEMFARHGYEGVSIRDLTDKAGCNLAAIHYYFGDKQTLYEDVFLRRLRELTSRRAVSIKEAMSQRGGATLESLLRAYAKAFVEPLADHRVSQRLMMLLTREMVEHRLPKQMFLDEMAIATMQPLEQALRTVCPFLSAAQAKLVIHSIIGQLVHIVHVSISPVPDSEAVGPFRAEDAIEHIVKFSAAGIRAYEGGKRK